jgi:hypothetical protein
VKAIFIKVPRTGSSAFSHILYRVYDGLHYPVAPVPIPIEIHNPDDRWYTDRENFKKEWHDRVEELDWSGHRYIHVHAPLELWDGFWEGVPRIAFVRNPVDFVISGYFFARHLGHIEKDMTIYQYAKLSYRRNWQSMLVGKDLSRLAYIGCFERYGLSVLEISQLLNWEYIPAAPILNSNLLYHKNYMARLERYRSDVRLLNLVSKYHQEDIKLWKSVYQNMRKSFSS